MVKTWKDSWFEENGLRVLYILPRAWTDQTLPMTMNPAPRELVRVMVGRAEIIPPDQQQRIRESITRAVEAPGDATARFDAKEEFRRLGRFAEPALGLALQQAPHPVNEAGWRLWREVADEERAKAARLETNKVNAAATARTPAQVQVQALSEARAL
jgi:type II secretory pathway component HofQ